MYSTTSQRFENGIPLRLVHVTVNRAELRQGPNSTSSLVATLEKDVVLEVIEAKLNNGWIKVKHRDGGAGYILISSTWGFN